MAAFVDGSRVVPGDCLGQSPAVAAGPGTYVDNGGSVRACVVGVVRHAGGGGPTVSVDAGGRAQTSLLPKVGDIVSCKVVRINPRVANVDITCTAGGSVVLQETCSGIIRKEDVRQFDQDSVEMFKCMRPGDVINARVLSLGDSRSYYLSTAENELGVILAKSVSGATMVPLSHEEMQCPKTQVVELRKVAQIRDAQSSVAT
ncbi:hypothetical protein T492DRAFT_998882 [Pavlovales sp. CCMP2436]|nr:hypothetical protein T492DRAFT_998882 [Pavlovales sp. CCMP2436]|mmetsp:Transcript_33069/g.82247  ORF Transcript_33069/g.82247 Transcript_33069/m.82247 type:complete len:202 (-) Transcript_33069:91-696(-)